MLVFVLFYGVRFSSNGFYFVELENKERKRGMSIYSLVMYLSRVLGIC